MFEATNLSHSYGSYTVFSDLNFSMKPGGCYGLVGLNGVGKSTLLTVMSGAKYPQLGDIKVSGDSIFADRNVYARQVSFLNERNPLDPYLSPWDLLKFICDLKGLSDEHIEHVVNTFGLNEFLFKKCSQISKGQSQRVGLAVTTLGEPKVLLLDEPMNGLDPKQLKELNEYLTNLKGKMTTLISSHNVDHLIGLCDEVLLLQKGKLTLHDPQGMTVSDFERLLDDEQ